MENLLFEFDKNANLMQNIDVQFEAEHQRRTDKMLFQFDQDASVNLKPKSVVKVLCLHGRGCNQKVMEYQMSKLFQQYLGDAVQFDCIEGPLETPCHEKLTRPQTEWKVCARGESDIKDPNVRKLFTDNKLYTWLSSKHHLDKHVDAQHRKRIAQITPSEFARNGPAG